jgi:DNA modification methylase
MNYDEFIEQKSRKAMAYGFEPYEITAPLFDWQKHVASWAVRKGRAALFEECGLGKTLQQLEWASQITRYTGKPVIVLTPLSVANQTQREAVKFGYTAKVVAEESEIDGPGIYITNYDKLDHFENVDFGGVVLDESSILKNFKGSTRIALTKRFEATQFRLCCTATPSPNDYTEFGQHADFLGICSPSQMLATYFINDTFTTGDWRLKKHAENVFWEWVSSWAACISKPSDIGFDDEGYNLPALNLNTIIVDVDEVSGRKEGELIRFADLSATTMHQELRMTAQDRVNAVADLANNSDESWLVWCNTNTESEMLTKAIPDAVEVRGSHTPKYKEKAISDFLDGTKRVIISKAGMMGYGLNFQHCRNVAFVGLSYSFEDFYQALRRSYRFGQKREVNAFVIHATTEGPIMKTIKRKMKQHEEMQQQMKIAAECFKDSETKRMTMKTEIDKKQNDNWTLYHGDCVRVAREIEDHSIDFSVFSPPFADLFTYSNDLQDMGNCEGLDDFTKHFEILIAEMKRIMVPGREVAVHCVDLLSTKWKTGAIQFQDFSGEIIRAFWRHGFLFHSRICIWKNPVTEMQRTKAHGLLHATLKKDSSDSRVGCADYLLVFKAPGKNPKPITKDATQFPVSWWQEVASPVWMTIDQGNVLNKSGARDHQDEKHICPLQLDVIERAITLWSNPGDLVYSPFTGIGSEGVGALRLGRQFVGSELKESYFQQACGNLNNATAQQEMRLF